MFGLDSAATGGAGLLVGTVAKYFLDRWWESRKADSDREDKHDHELHEAGEELRNELRKDNQTLREVNGKLLTDLDIWRDKYFSSMQKLVEINAELQKVSLDVKALKAEYSAALFELQSLKAQTKQVISNADAGKVFPDTQGPVKPVEPTQS